MHFENDTTRRAIVKTGAKMAYAAPLVAVTMKMSTGGAFAASPPQTQTFCSGPGLDYGPNG